MRTTRKIGLIMFVIAVIFAVYALRHPELSLPLSPEKTKTVYRLYVVLMLLFLIAPFGRRKKRKKEKER